MDETRFEQLFTRYRQRLIRYAMSLGAGEQDAEEIASEAFCRLWRARSEFAETEEAAILSWLYRAVKLIYMEYVRRNRAGGDAVCIDDYADRLIAEETATETVERAETERLIGTMEAGMSDAEKAIFRKLMTDERPYREIAADLHMNPATLRTRLARLRM